MDYFSTEFVGIALAIVAQSIWRDFRRAARHH